MARFGEITAALMAGAILATGGALYAAPAPEPLAPVQPPEAAGMSGEAIPPAAAPAARAVTKPAPAARVNVACTLRANGTIRCVFPRVVPGGPRPVLVVRLFEDGSGRGRFMDPDKPRRAH